MRTSGRCLAAVAIVLSAAAARAQQPARREPVFDSAATRLSILIAEDHRAATPRELAVLRGGARSRDAQTVRIAIRALGRLERPALIPDLIPGLRHPLPEVRAEAAVAIGQAAQGWKSRPPAARAAGASSVDAAAAVLVSRLNVEAEPSVRAALCETLGRLPYRTAGEVERAAAAIVAAGGADAPAETRLGVAKGLEALVRMHQELSPASAGEVARLRELARLPAGVKGGDRAATATARVRRLAVSALGAVRQLDPDTAQAALHDLDQQVRREAVKALDAPAARAALSDDSAIVRIEAVRVLAGAAPEAASCAALVTAARDRVPHVAIAAIDALARCVPSGDVTDWLAAVAADVPVGDAGRRWHQPAHALVALAALAPERASSALPAFAASPTWQVRMYAARAAAALEDRDTLERLANDREDNVREAAVAGLSKLVGHADDAVYVAALERRDYQLIRTAARALAGAFGPDEAVRALRAALRRLAADGRDNSRDAQRAVAATLGALGSPVPPLEPPSELRTVTQLTGEDLARLQSARARITIRDLGTFEVALITAEAPASVIRFARLAESGYYNNLTFHRIVPNFVIQGGSPGANEYVGDAAYMRDELGLWPHVRGAVGISTRGRDTGDAQIFIDLVDNPRLDHQYTVFAQVLSGIDVADAILEGDVIERIEILTTAQ